MIKASFGHSQGCLSGHSSAKVADLAWSWCSISRTVWTNALVDHGRFSFQPAIYCSCTSLHTSAVHYTVNWRPFPLIWIYSYPTARYVLFLLLQVLWTTSRCASWVIFLVAVLAASRWTNRCLRSWCVPISEVFDVVSDNPLDSDPLTPGRWGGVSVIHWGGIGQEDDHEKKWEVLGTELLASCQNGISSSQHVLYTQDESCCAWLQVARVCNCPVICNKLVWCCLFVYRDKLWSTTAEIAWLWDINRTLFKGKNVCWCLSQIFPGILHETDANNQVMLYS